MTIAITAAPPIVEFLQPDDDQQRRDLRHHRQVAGDEDHRAVFADAAGERERKAGEQRRQDRRQHDLERPCAGGWRRAAPRLPRSPSRVPASTGCTVRTTNGRPTKISATTTPSGVKATLMPSGASKRADPAIRRIDRRQRDAGDRGRQRERQIDRRIEDALAGKAVAHQHPGHEQPENRVDGGRDEAPRRRTAAAPPACADRWRCARIRAARCWRP